MPYQVTAQNQSENDVDITGALFNDNDDDDSDVSEARVGGGPTSGSRSLVQHGDLEVGDGLALDDAADGYGSDDKDFITAIQAASNRKASTLKGRTVKKGGGFQAMGLNANLLKAITRKGFTVPTPIQRKTIPLVLDGQDVVGMARTGSGKTAAFVVPLIEKLKTHSAKVGARSLILSPSRELALQTLKVVKELGRGTDLKCVLLVGGDSLEEQFGFMDTNPDILIATPGRFLHLQVEMSLDLSSMSYVVFDEADRLFEMGFAAQLREIIHALPSSRQTLLFSATLPKSLVEFARAGLQDPRLVRLDTESKISPDLQSAYFTVKTEEKEGALLHVLFDVIKMPTGAPEGAQARATGDVKAKKRKRGAETPSASKSPTEHSTIVFTATKHHVEYLASLLRAAGFAVSHAYGSLDQTARKMQVQDFRSGITNILVVTDVAARGIDIPILANVINYDFPAQPKIFVHRVGRTARAGKQGWSYSFVRDADAPYLLDLQLFLGKSLTLGSTAGSNVDFSKDVTVGSLGRDRVETSCEWVKKILEEDVDLAALRSVAAKGEKLYLRTRNSASSESAKRAKDITASNAWLQLHPLFNADTDGAETARTDMLARISGFRPLETVFEIGKRGGNSSEAAEIMRERRKDILTRKAKRLETQTIETAMSPQNTDTHITDTEREYSAAAADDTYDAANMDSASDEELEVTFSQSNTRNRGSAKDYWKDSEHFMSYAPTSTNAAEDRGYGVHSGSYNTARQNSNFVEAARGAVMDLTNDEGAGSIGEPSRARGLRWDKQQKKYVSRANDEDGSKGARMIKGESGQKIAASFRSGRFDAWRKSNKINRMQRVGELEKPSSHLGQGGSGRMFRHREEKAPKEADRFRDDYHIRKKRVEEARANRVGKFAESKSKKELRGVDDVRKQRNVKAKRRDKNARPSKRRKA